MSETEKSKIEERVFKVLKEQIGERDITLETDLIEDLLLDSLDRVEMMLKLEDEFSIKISDEEVDKLYSQNKFPVSKIVEYISNKVAGYSEK